MAIKCGYVEMIASLSLVLCILHSFQRRLRCKNPMLIDWPILGMLPQLVCNMWHIHDYVTHVFMQKGTTVEFMGPWFTGMNYLATCDPINVHHIMSKSFHNYVKGSDFRDIFDAFGEGIFTADSDKWKYHRSLLHALFKSRSFEMFLERMVRKKVESSLLPILEHVHARASHVDLQDVFNRFTFDNICSIVLGYDPNCLSIDFPEVACEKAFNEMEESIFYRHTVPKFVWKLQRLLQVGGERKTREACKVFDQFIYSCIASKREELSKFDKSGDDEAHVDVLATLMMREENGGGDEVHDDKFLRDSAFNLFVAGRDTITSALTWFFWLVATNPSVEAKILDEIEENFGAKSEEKDKVLGMEEVKKLVYLHGALCEALRLFPPIPFERKQPINWDMLPSGHHVNPSTIILLFLYSMGRSEEIWGKDCLEFKPERWISEKGKFVFVPSYKFISFNAGPRTCLGKDLSFLQMKMVATAILRNYRVQVVKGHQIVPSLSIVLLMKHGFKVRVTKREASYI